MRKFAFVPLAALVALGACSEAGNNPLNPDAAQLARGGNPQVQSTPGNLATPTNVAANVSGNQVTVTWDAVSGAVSYNVVFETPAGYDGTGIPAAPNHEGTTLIRDISEVDFSQGQFCVKVRANAAPGQGPNNSAFSATDCFSNGFTIVMDVKPGNGDEVDPINLQDASDILPIALFGSAGVDVSKIDIASLRIGSSASATTGVATKNNGGFHASIEHVRYFENVDPDSYLDLSIKVNISELVANGDIDASTTVLYVTGTYDGAPFTTSDLIRIVP
jgi:hypothetical protein